MLCMYIFFLNVCLPSFFHVDVPETKQELHRITSLFFSSYIRSYTGWFIEIPVMVKKKTIPATKGNRIPCISANKEGFSHWSCDTISML